MEPNVRFEAGDVPPWLPLWLAAGLAGFIVIVLLGITIGFPLADHQQFRGPLQVLPPGPRLQVAPGDDLAKLPSRKAEGAPKLDRCGDERDGGAGLGTAAVTRWRLCYPVASGHVASRRPGRSSAFSGLAFRQHPGAQLPLDVPLTDQAGRGVTLGQELAARPAISYSNICAARTLCSLVLGGAVVRSRPHSLRRGSKSTWSPSASTRATRCATLLRRTDDATRSSSPETRRPQPGCIS